MDFLPPLTGGLIALFWAYEAARELWIGGSLSEPIERFRVPMKRGTFLGVCALGIFAGFATGLIGWYALSGGGGG